MKRTIKVECRVGKVIIPGIYVGISAENMAKSPEKEKKIDKSTLKYTIKGISLG